MTLLDPPRFFLRLACSVTAICGMTGLAAAASLPSWAEMPAQDAYKVPEHTTRMVEKFGVCQEVTNDGPGDLMIPVGSPDEYFLGSASFIASTANRTNVLVSPCRPYFYMLQGCTVADHGQSDCVIIPEKRTLTSEQVRKTGSAALMGDIRTSGSCRIGSSNYGDLIITGERDTGAYRPMRRPSGWTDAERYDESWGFGGLWRDQDGSAVIPSKELANALHKSTVDYSKEPMGNRTDRIWWEDDWTSCIFSIIWAEKAGEALEFGEAYIGNGMRMHRGLAWEGDNGASGVAFVLVRVGDVPNVITNDVIRDYMVDAPPQPQF